MRKEKETKRKYGIIYILLILLVSIAAILYLQSTMAQYRTEAEGTGTAEVALWNVKFKGNEAQFGETINMDFTANTSAYVVEGKIAPSLSATGTGTIRLTDTETAVKYTLEAEIPEEYQDLNLTITGVKANGSTLTPSAGVYSQIVQLPDGKAFENADDIDLEITVTWANGTNDTPIGEAGEPIELPITVIVEQYQGI